MDVGEVEGRLLVDVVVQPVGVEQMGGAAPGGNGRLGTVVAREIVGGELDGKPLIHIPKIFLGQGGTCW